MCFNFKTLSNGFLDENIETISLLDEIKSKNENEIIPIFQNPFFQLENSLFEVVNSDNDRYLLPKEPENSKSKKMFKLQKEKKENKLKGKKIGRKKKSNIFVKDNEIIGNKNFHDKNKTDNLIRKIQVHYISFLLSFINEIIKNLNIKETFLKLDYQMKKEINKKSLESLKNKTIGEIISSKISTKYRNKVENYNEIIFKEIKNKSEVLKNIFSQNYLTFFKSVYYKSNNRINLKSFGLDKEIILSNKVEMYKDFLKNKDFDSLHIRKLNSCMAKNFYPELIFMVNYN